MRAYRTLLGTGVTGLAIMCTASLEAQVFRYSQWLPATHFTQKEVMHVWFKDIEEATEGRVRILPTAKGLGAPSRHYQLAIDGISDVIFQPHGYTPGVHPLSEIAELPFITRDTEANSVAYWRVFKKYLQPGGMHKEVHTLAVHVHPAGHVYNNKREIRNIDDFNGIKLRSTNYIVSEALKMFGAVPVAGPVTALRNGLSKGVYDGTSFTDEAIYAFHIQKFIKYITRFPGGLYNTSFMVVMNRNAWGKIAEADQKRVMALSGEAYSKRIGKIWDTKVDESTALVKADNKSVHVLAGPTLDRIKGMLSRFETEWIAKAKKQGVDGVAALKAFRAEVAQYQP